MATRLKSNTSGAKNITDNRKKQSGEALSACPYEEKKCFECETQECPEESE